ncbi:hypothetical protein [Amylibacter sp. IMCC11727]|uniref:hypothetical protein n=1 Tax=Amylibacter sp. IMCC11727 TaxID=3039851 RepID=UPI00244DE37C|nr:hypothetical protein [Amylibacter sp. IMCC11727]WGI21837.1 hypothetical protein QBD29_17275 [Amylibacter sp. IMCC11727]
MTDIDLILDKILGGAFWLALLAPLVLFGYSMVMSILKKGWLVDENGHQLHVDQAILNKVFALGSTRGTRRIDGERQMTVTMGLRGASLAVMGFGIYWYYDMITVKEYALSYMDALLIGGIAYYVLFSWTFSVRYEHDTLWVRGWTFRLTEYDLRELDSMTSATNGTWKLWFADGRKVEVLKFITDSNAFSADMRARVAHNISR